MADPAATTSDPVPTISRAGGGRRVLRLLLATGFVVAVLYAAADRLIEDVLEIESAYGQVFEIVLMALVTSLVLWVGVLRPLLGQVDRERRSTEAHQRQIQATAQRQQFESQLHRALEMSGTEEAAYRTTGKALRTVMGARDRSCCWPTPVTPTSNGH